MQSTDQRQTTARLPGLISELAVTMREADSESS